MDTEATFWSGITMILSGDPVYLDIVGLSLRVTLSSVFFAALIGLPVGTILAITRFRHRGTVIVVVNAFMGLPPVVVGLVIFLLLSRSGPLGILGWLFTPKAMITAQAILVMPIMIALTRQTIEDLWKEYGEHLRSLDLAGLRAVPTLLWDARFSLTTVLLAGFGRAIAEVGSVIIVGGNIAGYTRIMTTAIALETSKGDLPLALGLGVTLIGLTVIVNAAAFLTGRFGARFAG